ncbi:aldehyde dehydrogenase (NAD+) [Acidovorax delafieldii]|uniref:4-(hydroxymethyl)benzenesulfonate dehydrogenase n=2 Tax=Acidovorax TaxID=12916 RepID=A0AAJ2BWD6_ACIDE|nr:aldehyde dehydrogenase family protein [Acidovorax delafieldii]MDR6766824.1 aldehyde dehydrogenase (NAD+) [Acidovorax delafieldii]MDR6838460.1 aldehyde dehydrogenase (NAD+) [Acidovorax delafieldii]MDR7367536.1 aldehyde dehydrogenase (NAD+) [Acidovorax delafieldii]
MKLGDLQLSPRHLINGRWEIGTTTGISTNPSDTREVVAEYARADRNQTELAVRAAADALPSWSQSTPQRRADVLDMIGSELLARKDELGALLAREEGKTLPEGVAEVARSGQIFKFFAGEALRIQGELLASVRQGVQVDVTREPVGVVGIIAPWNFPFAIPAWKIAPALAYGNTVVFKPAELVPACGWALAEIISRSGLPAGAFNLVMGSGREVGQTLVDHPLVNALSFTGSVSTGDRILRAASARRAKVQLEMGGKNPLIVLADADLDQAVDCALQGSYFSTGQRCTASSRLIVEAEVHDAFVARLRNRLASLKVGHALERGTEMGPVVDDNQLAQNLGYIDIARNEGAEHVWGGERLERPTPGHYMSPALFLARPEHRVAREEIFGPVACVLRADDYEHALALANDTPFGLCAGICTTSLKRAMHFKRHAAVGMTMVNLPTAGVDFHVPFGGRKESSYGAREQGRYAAEFYTTVKTGYMLA